MHIGVPGAVRLSMGFVLLAGCGTEPLAVTETEGRQITLSVGQELLRTLGTVGPGNFASPPAVSSEALRFLEVSSPGVQVPSGETQVFRFRAERAGVVTVTFTHTYANRIVEDVITVR